MTKSSIRQLKREQRYIRGYTISRKLYHKIFVEGDKHLHQTIEDYYRLFLFGDYGNVSSAEETANKRARALHHGQIRAVYGIGIDDIFFHFDYKRYENGLVRVMYVSEKRACEDKYLDIQELLG